MEVSNPMITRIVSNGNFKFIVYLGVLTKEICFYCGLNKYNGSVLDHSIVQNIESLIESSEEDDIVEMYSKMAKIVAVFYCQMLQDHCP
jgi:hypothetical protein